MFDQGTRMHGIAMLAAIALPLLGVSMAWSEITGKCLWVRSAGTVVLCVLATLLAGSMLVMSAILVAWAVRMIAVGT